MTPTMTRLRGILAEHIGPAAEQETPDDKIIWKSASAGEEMVAGDLDSLDKVEFLMAAEEEFGIDIPDAIAGGIGSLKQIADYLDAALPSANAN